MNRREFLINATIGGVTVPLLITEIGCSDDDDNGGPATGSETFPSAPAQGHSHTITIADSDLTAGGAHSYTSNNVSGHTHTVNLDATQIDNLSLGCVVNETSSTDSGHFHTWQILFADLVIDVETTSQLDTTGHTHTVTVVAEDLVGVPTVRSLPTSDPNVGPPHTHSVELEVADFQALQSCQSVLKTTTADGTGHSHSFLITRA